MPTEMIVAWMLLLAVCAVVSYKLGQIDGAREYRGKLLVVMFLAEVGALIKVKDHWAWDGDDPDNIEKFKEYVEERSNHELR